MEIWQMKYFIQVCNDKSFSKAAKNLFISQQGLSKTIKNIEDEFSIPLFNRSVKGVVPTEYGEILLEKIQHLVNEYDQIVEYITNYAQLNKGTISIGLSSILHSEFFTTIYKFQEEFPDIKLELIELGSYACEKYLDDNLIDLCFAVKPDNMIDYGFIPVYKYDMMLLANKQNKICNKEKVNIKDLKYEKFIMLSTDYRIRNFSVNSCEQAGFEPNIVITTTQLDFIIELVDLNIGIAILPVLNILKAKKMCNNVKVLLFDESPFHIEVGYIFSNHRKLDYITNALIKYTTNYKKRRN